MTTAKKRPAALRGRDGGPARTQPRKVTFDQVKEAFDLAMAELDDAEEDVLGLVLDLVKQKSCDFLRVGDKRGEELMDELHRELEQLR